jgi:hypothetical protein
VVALVVAEVVARVPASRLAHGPVVKDLADDACGHDRGNVGVGVGEREVRDLVELHLPVEHDQGPWPRRESFLDGLKEAPAQAPTHALSVDLFGLGRGHGVNDARESPEPGV